MAVTLKNTGIQGGFSKIIAGNGIFFLDGHLISTNGSIWSEIPNHHFINIIYVEGYFIGNEIPGSIYYSRDGINWEPIVCSSMNTSVVFVNNTVLALCNMRIFQSDPIK